MSNVKTLTFGPIMRFRVLSGDMLIIQAAAARAGQTVSAYLRESAVGRALDDYGVKSREDLLKRLGKQKPKPAPPEAPPATTRRRKVA